jgi:4-hydroxy-tetrahydrodipicolinate synthase
MRQSPNAAALDTVVAVLPTPFLESGALDLEGFERVLARALDGGVRALTVAGNTGEFGALGPDEIMQLVTVAARSAPRAAILVGVGTDLGSATRVAQLAAGAGVFGVMVHEPPGPFRTGDGWVAYHAAIARAVPDLAVVPYLRDASIGANDLRALVRECGNVVAVKYAVPDPVRFAALAEDVGPGVLWICGLAELWAPFFRAGGATAFTSGLAVVVPRLSLTLLTSVRAAQWSAALQTWSLLRPFEELRARRQAAANVPAIKEALAQLGVIGRTVRPPITELPQSERDEIAGILEQWTREEGSAAA